MRNLAQYPITQEEMLRAIKRAADSEVERLSALPPNQVPVGDVHVAALQAAHDRLYSARPQLYLDCDGVLADFDKFVTGIFKMDPREWESNQAEILYQDLIKYYDPEADGPWTEKDEAELRKRCAEHASRSFWEKLYETPDLFEQFDVCEDAHELVKAVKHLNPIVLTGCPRGYWAIPQKLRWRDRHFPDLPMICIESVNKRMHCRPGDILVDDWDKYQGHWQEAGGIFVLHTDTASTLQRLKELGVL